MKVPAYQHNTAYVETDRKIESLGEIRIRPTTKNQIMIKCAILEQNLSRAEFCATFKTSFGWTTSISTHND